jgi:hypothetical protein
MLAPDVLGEHLAGDKTLLAKMAAREQNLSDMSQNDDDRKVADSVSWFPRARAPQYSTKRGRA